MDYNELRRMFNLSVNDIDELDKVFIMVENLSNFLGDSASAFQRVQLISYCNLMNRSYDEIVITSQVNHNIIKFSTFTNVLKKANKIAAITGEDSLVSVLIELVCFVNNIEFSMFEKHKDQLSWFQNNLNKKLSSYKFKTDDNGLLFFIRSDETSIDVPLYEAFQNLSPYKEFQNRYREYIDRWTQQGNSFDPNEIANGLRLLLEEFLKSHLNVKSPLEKITDQQAFGTYFDKRNINPSIKNMTFSLIRYYAQYHNEKSKHNSTVEIHELGFVFGVMASIVNLIMNIENSINIEEEDTQ